jgi:phosphoserine phosphatase RsbU/P
MGIIIKGAVLGLSQDTNYVTEEVQLHTGEIILLYTDGVTEDRSTLDVDNNNQLKEMFAQIEKSETAQIIVDGIYEKVRKFHGENVFDDQTLLLFKKEI